MIFALFTENIFLSTMKSSLFVQQIGPILYQHQKKEMGNEVRVKDLVHKSIKLFACKINS